MPAMSEYLPVIGFGHHRQRVRSLFPRRLQEKARIGKIELLDQRFGAGNKLCRLFGPAWEE
jgi:hypothetical protein